MEAVLNAAQQVVAAYRYDPFGNVVAQTGSLTQPYGFSTKRTDPRTGLVFYERRPYDPATARWLTRDPLGEAGGLNLYAFVGQNPVNWVDPWGLEYAEYYAAMFGVGGGLTGAALVGSGGAAICSPSGPGAAVCALVGGKGGAVAGTALGTAFGYALGSTIDTASMWAPVLMVAREHGETYLTREVLEQAKRTGQDPCAILNALQKAEECKGRYRDKKRLVDIKKAKKFLDCRRHRGD